MEGRFPLDAVAGEGAVAVELLAGKYKALLIGRDAFSILDLSLYVLNRVAELNIKRDGLLARGHFHKNLHAAVTK